ncbi:MAG: RNA methyltransferase, TrmH family [candidate division WS6 bacterium GW2011_GWF2_39_15]|uniref:RNA methyltransferase, TrmH family n=1 Tax=candidate division WS6 bacterium GW2011_GWF2_39_15 TaxID=1619100 RepID=A0A0G0MTI9_9BACT|nr:MAG: RNA methyltransferase, TrmH family [candidate division WS6 bacterium GW2011_GWF2_39_15]
MKDPKLKRYDKDFEYSYAFGTYPTIDLLKSKPEKVLKVLLKQEGFGSEGVNEIVALCEEKGIKYEVNDRVIDKLSVKENTYSIGVFEKYECEIDKNSNHIVLDQPRNMGNIGTIIRTMVGFGFKDLILIKPAADIFDPTIVRSAMGALFSINFKYYDSIEGYSNEFPLHNKYLFMLNGAKNIEEVPFKSPYALVFGTESAGLSDEYAKLGESVYIKHEKDIDSLNLSVAVGIALYKSSLNKL